MTAYQKWLDAGGAKNKDKGEGYYKWLENQQKKASAPAKDITPKNIWG